MEATGRKPCRALDLFYACDLAFCLRLSPFAFQTLKEKKLFPFLVNWPGGQRP
jgi:hypothetical protein